MSKQQSAVEWMQKVVTLYDKYGVWLSVYMVDKNEFHWEAEINGEEYGSNSSGYFKTPSEAYQAGIEYITNKII